jgi:hypothetical protein
MSQASVAPMSQSPLAVGQNFFPGLAPSPSAPAPAAPQAQPASAPSPPGDPGAQGVPDVSAYGTSEFVPVRTGGSPAREFERRAPSVNEMKGHETAAHSAMAEEARSRNETVATLNELANVVNQEQVQAEVDTINAQLAARKEALDGARIKYMEAIDNVAAKAAKVDPDAGWNSMNTAGKLAGTIGSGISMMLAAGGSGKMVDYVKGQTEKMMEGDFRKQKFEYEAAKDGAVERRNMYGEMLQEFGSEPAARAAMRAATLDATVARLEVQKSKEKSAQVRNAYDDTISSLLKDAMHWKETGTGYLQPTSGGMAYRRIGPDGRMLPFLYTADQARGVADKESAWQQGNVTETGKGQMELQKEREKQRGETERATAKGKDNVTERFVPTSDGVGYLASTKEEAEKLREGSAAVNSAIASLERLNALEESAGLSGRALSKGSGMATFGTTKVQTEDMRRAESVHGGLVAALNHAGRLGALDKETLKLLMGRLGGVDDLMGNRARREEIARELRTSRFAGQQSQTGGSVTPNPKGAEPVKQ